MMSSPLERIPGSDALNNAINRLFPIADEYADAYRRLTGAWVAIGAYATYETIEWAEKSFSHTDPVTFLGTIAVTAMPAAAAGFTWRRGWKSKGEVDL